MSIQPLHVSIIVPCYNEIKNVIPLVEQIHAALEHYTHEILVVDDNSPDGTYETLIKKNYPYVRPFLRKENRGLANSIRYGLENANGKIWVVMDSDFNHQPSYIPFMVDNTRYYDCVLGSRFQYGGKMEPRSRHLLSWLFNIFTRAITGGMVTDSLYGFFAIRKEVLEKVDYNKIFWGYGDYCIRMLYYLQKNKISILQFPVVNGRRLEGEGNNRFIKVFWQYFTEVCRLVWRERMTSI